MSNRVIDYCVSYDDSHKDFANRLRQRLIAMGQYTVVDNEYNQPYRILICLISADLIREKSDHEYIHSQWLSAMQIGKQIIAVLDTDVEQELQLLSEESLQFFALLMTSKILYSFTSYVNSVDNLARDIVSLDLRKRSAKSSAGKGTLTGATMKSKGSALNDYSLGGTDTLSYSAYAAGIASLLATAQTPLCCGICAKWGAGKTFLASKIKYYFTNSVFYSPNRQRPGAASCLRTWPQNFFLFNAVLDLTLTIFRSYVVQTFIELYRCIILENILGPFRNLIPDISIGVISPLPKYLVVDYNAWEFNRSDELWTGIIRNIYQEVEMLFQSTAVSGGLYIDLKTYWRVEKAKRLLYARFGKSVVDVVLIAFALGLILLVTFGRWATALKWSEYFGIKLVTYIGMICYGCSALASTYITYGAANVSRGEAIFADSSNSIRNSECFMKRVREELSELFDFLTSTSVITSNGSGVKLLLFIDDLDRCVGGDRIVKVLEAIQLLVNIPSAPVLLFLIVDSRIIVSSIETTLNRSMSLGDTNITGWEYLAKMQQITFCIPEPNASSVEKLMLNCAKRQQISPWMFVEKTRQIREKLLQFWAKHSRESGVIYYIALPNDYHRQHFSQPITIGTFVSCLDCSSSFEDQFMYLMLIKDNILSFVGQDDLKYLRDLEVKRNIDRDREKWIQDFTNALYYAVCNFKFEDSKSLPRFERSKVSFQSNDQPVDLPSRLSPGTVVTTDAESISIILECCKAIEGFATENIFHQSSADQLTELKRHCKRARIRLSALSSKTIINSRAVAVSSVGKLQEVISILNDLHDQIEEVWSGLSELMNELRSLKESILPLVIRFKFYVGNIQRWQSLKEQESKLRTLTGTVKTMQSHVEEMIPRDELESWYARTSSTVRNNLRSGLLNRRLFLDSLGLKSSHSSLPAVVADPLLTIGESGIVSAAEILYEYLVEPSIQSARPVKITESLFEACNAIKDVSFVVEAAIEQLQAVEWFTLVDLRPLCLNIENFAGKLRESAVGLFNDWVLLESCNDLSMHAIAMLQAEDSESNLELAQRLVSDNVMVSALVEKLSRVTDALVALAPIAKLMNEVNFEPELPLLPAPICELLVLITNRIDPNPRRIKRIINALQLVVEIASNKSISDSSTATIMQDGRWPAFLEKLAVWVVLCDCYPLRISFLVRILTDLVNIRDHNKRSSRKLCFKFLSDKVSDEDFTTLDLGTFYFKYVASNIQSVTSDSQKLLQLDCDAIMFSSLICEFSCDRVRINCGDILGPIDGSNGDGSLASRDKNFSLLSHSYNLNPSLRSMLIPGSVDLEKSSS